MEALVRRMRAGRLAVRKCVWEGAGLVQDAVVVEDEDGEKSGEHQTEGDSISNAALSWGGGAGLVAENL